MLRDRRELAVRTAIFLSEEGQGSSKERAWIITEDERDLILELLDLFLESSHVA